MDKSRQQFEEEMAKYLNVSIEFISKERRGDRYYSYSMNFAFDVWQASRESLKIELPERKHYSGFQQFDDGYERAIDDCENILISNGVKIKNE